MVRGALSVETGGTFLPACRRIAMIVVLLAACGRCDGGAEADAPAPAVSQAAANSTGSPASHDDDDLILQTNTGGSRPCGWAVVLASPDKFDDFGPTVTGVQRNVSFLLRRRRHGCDGDGSPRPLLENQPSPDDVAASVKVDNVWVASASSPSNRLRRLEETEATSRFGPEALDGSSNATGEFFAFNVTVVGDFLGFANLEIYIRQDEPNAAAKNSADEGGDLMVYRYPIAIHRDEANVMVDRVFIITVSVLVMINNVFMGCQLDLGVIASVLKRPVGPLVGFLSQFVVMPLLSFGFAMALLPDGLTRLGLFTLGCSPGGTNSNFWTILFDGDINLSVTMTAISTVAAMGMMPLWLSSLSSYMYDADEGYSPRIPYTNLVMSIVSLTIPLIVGILICRWKPGARRISSRVLKPFTLLLATFLLTMGVYSNSYVFFLLTGRMLLAGFFVAVFGFLVGAVGAYLARLPVAQIKAVSIETALQNAGIALIVLKLSLPRPGADLAVASPTAQLLMTGPPMWLGLAVFKLYQCARNKKKDGGAAAGDGAENKQPETGGKDVPESSKTEKKIKAAGSDSGASPSDLQQGTVNPVFNPSEV